MPFPVADDLWQQVRRFLAEQARDLAPVLAPNEFLQVWAGTYHYSASDHLPASFFAYVVIHKGMLEWINRAFLDEVLRRFHPVFANEVFVIFAFMPSPKEMEVRRSVHFHALLRAVENSQASGGSQGTEQTAIVVTTFERPDALEGSLPSLARLGVPILVVDDGSSSETQKRNRCLAERHRCLYLALPGNRGLCCSINAGVGYWLADPDVAWISLFTDDVEVEPHLLEAFAKIQDRDQRPVLVGRLAEEHPVFGEAIIGGYRVLYQRSSPGFPYHAHREYWRAVLPVPTPYLGAPKPSGGRPGQGSEADWWIGSWSPRSVVKQGGFIVCVPGLVRHTGVAGIKSTWVRSIPGHDRDPPGASAPVGRGG